MKIQYRYFIIIIFFIFISCAKEDRISCSSDNREIIQMAEWVSYLCSSNFGGRYSGTEGCNVAAQYICSMLPDTSSKIQPVPTINGISGMNNIIYEIDGKTDSIIVIGAHYDSYGLLEGEFRPGADDNMSGVAVLMLLANRLSESYNYKYEINVCFWDGEEIGRYGSRYYLSSCSDSDLIKLYINVDTCGSRCCYDLGMLYSQKHPALSELLCRYKSFDELSFIIEPYNPKDYTTDCEYFDQYNVPYLSIGSRTRPCHIHTIADQMSILDFNQMYSICNLLTNFIKEHYEYNTI